ncbi:MAG: glycosyltransferase family 39 protein [Candidatus Omnitrophota bacterium]
MAKLLAAFPITSPGHADPSYYYSVAENLYNGRGFQIDYIWHFLKKWSSLTHPSNDWWMPLNSILIFLSFKLFGLSILSSLMPNILLGSILPILIYFISKELVDDNNIALLAAILTLANPVLFINSLTLETIVPYVFFVGIVFILTCKTITKQHSKLYIWMLLGFFLAVCHLIRLDAFILIIAINLFFIYSKVKNHNLAYRYLLFMNLSYLMAMMPWFIRNYYVLGSILPSYLSKGIFLKTYEALYSYDFSLARKEYFELPLTSIIYLKIVQLMNCFNSLISKYVMSLFVFIYLGLIVNRNKIKLIPVALYFLLFVSFFMATSFGLDTNTLPSLLLFFIPLASQGLVLTADIYEKHLNSKKGRLLWSIVSILVFYNIILIGFDLKARYRDDRKLYKQYSELGLYLKSHYNPDDIVIMTRNPWEFNYFTKVKCVQIPYENLDTLKFLAKKYNVTHLLLPAPRSFLDQIYEGFYKDKDIVLEYRLLDSNLKLFHVENESNLLK